MWHRLWPLRVLGNVDVAVVWEQVMGSAENNL